MLFVIRRCRCIPYRSGIHNELKKLSGVLFVSMCICVFVCAQYHMGIRIIVPKMGAYSRSFCRRLCVCVEQLRRSFCVLHSLFLSIPVSHL